MPGSEFRIEGQGKLPPSNFRLTTPERLRAIFAVLPKLIGRAGVFLAGCATEEARRSLMQAGHEVWPITSGVSGRDADSGRAAAVGSENGIVGNARIGSA